MNRAILLALFVLTSCAGSVQVTPKPDVTPVRVAHQATVKSINDVKGDLVKFSTLVKELDCPQDKEKIVQLEGQITIAQDHAAAAAMHAQDVEYKLGELQLAIDLSHKNEQICCDNAKKYEEFWTKGHRWFGVGAVLLGFGLIFEHVLILIALLALLGIIFVVLSMIFPALGPVIGIVERFFSGLWDKIRNKK